MAATTPPAQARFTAAGTLQRGDGERRVTGRVTDSVANKSVGGFKATASERELFSLDDSLAEQVKTILRAQIPDQAPKVAVNNPLAPRKIFEGSDLQRAMNNPKPLRPAPRIVEAPPVVQVPPYYGDDDV